MNTQLIASARKDIKQILYALKWLAQQPPQDEPGIRLVVIHGPCLADYITSIATEEQSPLPGINFGSHILKRRQIEQIIDDEEYLYYLST